MLTGIRSLIKRNANMLTLARSYELLVILALFVIIILIRALDFPQPMGRDSSAFAYAGISLLKGKVPYKDFWDHKTPGIFFLDALVFLLFPDTPSSLHIFGVVYGLASAYAFYALGKQLWERRIAFLVAGLFAAFSSFPTLAQGGNLTESYALLPTILAYWFTLKFLKRREPRVRYLFASGLCAGLATSIKQTEIFSVAGVIVFLAATRLVCGRERRSRSSIMPIVAVILGFVMAWIPWLLYFGLNGALADFVSAAFAYNSLYVSRGFHIASLLLLMFKQSFVIAIRTSTIWILSLFAVFNFVLRPTARKQEMILVMLWLVFAAVGVSLGRAFYPHYYLQGLPPLSLLSGYAIERLIFFKPLIRIQGWVHLRAGFSLIILATLVASLVTQLVAWRDSIGYYLGIIPESMVGFAPYRTNYAVAEYIKAHTTQDDKILVWGAESTIYFLSQRESPTRYFYNYPLLTESYVTPEMKEEFLSDLSCDSPVYIVVVLSPTDACDSVASLNGFPEFSDFIAGNYALEKQVLNKCIFRRQY